jgi:hypothetical protein
VSASEDRIAALAMLDAVKVEQRNESLKLQAAAVRAILAVAGGLHEIAEAYQRRTSDQSLDRRRWRS